MPGIAVRQEVLEEILLYMSFLGLRQAYREVLAYIKCVRETGGDWLNPDCLRGTLVLPEPGPPGEELSLLEELLAQMPEDEQRQVAASIQKAQARLLEQYIPELEELTSSL